MTPAGLASILKSDLDAERTKPFGVQLKRTCVVDDAETKTAVGEKRPEHEQLPAPAGFVPGMTCESGSSGLRVHTLADDAVRNARRTVERLISNGSIMPNAFHGTRSTLFEGLERTGGKLVSTADLEDLDIPRRSGEGDVLSSFPEPRRTVAVANGERGLGTALAYVEAAEKLSVHNLQGMSDGALETELAALDLVVEGFDRLRYEPPHTSARYERWQLQERLVAIRHEITARNADAPAGYPLLLEMNVRGLAQHRSPSQGNFLANELHIEEGVDLEERLVRAYAPAANVEDAHRKLAAILGCEVTVIPLEGMSAASEVSEIESARSATYSGISAEDRLYHAFISEMAAALQEDRPVDYFATFTLAIDP